MRQQTLNYINLSKDLGIFNLKNNYLWKYSFYYKSKRGLLNRMSIYRLYSGVILMP